jgi:hypothetical protein
MGVPTLEVGYKSATTGRGDHEVQKGHVVAWGWVGSALLTRGYKVTVYNEELTGTREYLTL